MTFNDPTYGNRQLRFGYDYRGRRVQKKVYTWSGTSWGTPTSLYFVYDGWNVALVLGGATIRKYTWGLDLSGTLHGAGGVGGLLGESYGAELNYFLYDGNGNVVNVVSYWEDYAPIATYEYDAYGNTVASSGYYANSNPFRFSTKWLDSDLGTFALYYYGYRYYSPRLGRWVNRDPSGERGGRNLYQYCRNDPILLIDPLGRSPNTAKTLLDKEREEHSRRLYYEPAGVKTAFDKLQWALDQISVAATLGLLNEASYHDVVNEMRIKKDADGITVIHELVHALDDKMDWYITTWTSSERAEALAYGTEYLLARADGPLSYFDDMKIPNCRKAK